MASQQLSDSPLDAFIREQREKLARERASLSVGVFVAFLCVALFTLSLLHIMILCIIYYSFKVLSKICRLCHNRLVAFVMDLSSQLLLKLMALPRPLLHHRCRRLEPGAPARARATGSR